MSFKFDDDNDELELKLGDGGIKQQVPAPLPKKAIKPNGDVLNKLPRPGQSTGSPKEETTVQEEATSLPKTPSKPSLPTSPKKPSPKEAPQSELAGQEQRIPETFPEEDTTLQVPTIIEPAEEPETEAVQSTLLQQPTINVKEYVNTPVEETFQSNVILTPEETASTFKNKNPFEGDRKKILQIRIIAGIVAGLIMIAGVWSFIPKPGFKDDPTSINAALTFNAKYDSIRMASEAYALRFATDFLNRTETTEAYRQETMTTYMSPDALSQVDFTLASVPSSQNREGVKIYQQVTSGPYVYNVNNITAEAIQAQRVDGVNGFVLSILVSAYVTPYVNQNEANTVTESIPDLKPKWVYLAVPVMHNYETKQTTLYGFPTFVTPEITAGLDKYLTPYKEADWGSQGDDLSDNSVLVAQLENYLDEWSKQTPNEKVSSNLKALISSDATVRAQQGLAGKYTKVNGQNIIYNVNVKPLPEDVEATPSTLREALVTVKWTDNFEGISANSSQSVYVQQYVIYFKGSSDKWEIVDIKPRFTE